MRTPKKQFFRRILRDLVAYYKKWHRPGYRVKAPLLPPAGLYTMPKAPAVPGEIKHEALKKIIDRHIEQINHIKMVIDFIQEIEPDHPVSIQSHWAVRYKTFLKKSHEELEQFVRGDRWEPGERDITAEELDAEIWVTGLKQGKKSI